MNISIGDDVKNIVYNGNTVEKLVFNGNTVWEKPEKYFTVEALESGSIAVKRSGSPGSLTVYYWINKQPNSARDNYDGSKTLTSSSGTLTINVNANDKIRFFSTGASGGRWGYANSTSSYTKFELNIQCNIMGDITSLVNFNSNSSTYAFCSLFISCTGIIDARKLILPWTTLASYCYYYMFAGCSNLKWAPTLPAQSLVYNCYSRMFYYDEKLEYIKCLATTSISTSTLSLWTNGVASTGTFIKATGVTWLSGDNGIPYNWTVVEV